MNVLNQYRGENFILYHGDCCQVIKGMPDNSVHYTITSPPFSSLYVWSASSRDVGNCSSDTEFLEHFRFLVWDLLRVTKPGRLCSIHCMNLTTSISQHGFMGLKDLRGDIIRLFQSEGWIWASEVCIWKDPQIAASRNKTFGLLHGNIVKDGCNGRSSLGDYLVSFKKPGKNLEPVVGYFEDYYGDNHPPKLSNDPKGNSFKYWSQYASPVWHDVWMDINPSDTLQSKSAREYGDEKHITPLQLQVINRGLDIYSNEGDVIFDPFNGIGSTGYCALLQKCKYVGIELKESYYKDSVKNLQSVDTPQKTLFDFLEPDK